MCTFILLFYKMLAFFFMMKSKHSSLLNGLRFLKYAGVVVCDICSGPMLNQGKSGKYKKNYFPDLTNNLYSIISIEKRTFLALNSKIVYQYQYY